MTPRPVALPVNTGAVPDELQREDRWVLWRYEWRSGRWAKILCTPRGYHAKSNDPTTWGKFEEVLVAYLRGGFDGIGFCLGDGWAGVDFDHCRNLSGVVTANAVAFLQRVEGYLEVSPSGTGFKAVGRSDRIGGQIDFAVTPPAFTTWQGARFFAITGHASRVVFGDPTADITSALANWFQTQRTSIVPTARPDYIKEGDLRGTENIETRTDDEVLLAAATAINRAKFLKLFRGDLSGYGDDRSRADQALVSILVYWCAGDVDQADRLFRQSALMREKWETRSYRLATLNKAFALFQRGLSQ